MFFILCMSSMVCMCVCYAYVNTYEKDHTSNECAYMTFNENFAYFILLAQQIPCFVRVAFEYFIT